MIEKMKMSIVVVGFIFILFGVIYGSYKTYRYVNWNFGYKDMVVEQIKTEVKPSCLIGAEK